MRFFSRCLVAVLAVIGVASAAWAQDTVTIASWGGAFQAAQRQAMFEPSAKMLGITIKEDTLNGYGDVKTQVLAKAVKWDIAELGLQSCAQGTVDGVFEPLDYGVIKADGVNPKVVKPHWIGIIYYSNVIAWNTRTYAEKGPQSWKDFWDVKKFPGKRSLYHRPTETLEAALMADGVEPDKLYPLDVERGFRKLEELRPHIAVWWASGAQAAQLLKDGEVDMIGIWNGRASTVIKDGAKAAFTYNQGIMNADCLVVPKGAKNKTGAMKVINALVSPEIQAALPKLIDYGPVNSRAFTIGKLTTTEMDRINSSPKNAATQAVMDVEWWSTRLNQLLERMDAFKAKK